MIGSGLILSGPGRGAKVPILISTIETFLDIHGIATKSGDFPKFIGEQNSGNILCQRCLLLSW